MSLEIYTAFVTAVYDDDNKSFGIGGVILDPHQQDITGEFHSVIGTDAPRDAREKEEKLTLSKIKAVCRALQETPAKSHVVISVDDPHVAKLVKACNKRIADPERFDRWNTKSRARKEERQAAADLYSLIQQKDTVIVFDQEGFTDRPNNDPEKQLATLAKDYASAAATHAGPRLYETTRVQTLFPDEGRGSNSQRKILAIQKSIRAAREAGMEVSEGSIPAHLL